MFEMDDVVAFIELAEVNLRALAGETVPPLQPPHRVVGKSPKQFRSGQNDELPRGKTEAARQASFDQVDALENAAFSDDLAKALNLSFGLEVNDDACSLSLPFAQPREELTPLSLNQHKVADGK